MKSFQRLLVAGGLALSLGLIAAPAGSAATIDSTPMIENEIQRTWHATVQCQIVRISDHNVIGYERADGTGNTKEAAIKAAERNIPVPQGHYKRHCDAKRVW